jgi:hypothetical protein
MSAPDIPNIYIPYIVLVVTLAILGIAVLIGRRFNASISLTRALQFGLIAAGILGSFAHAFPISHKADEDLPALDLEALAWFALVPVGLLLPRISKIKLGEAEIELTEASKEAVQSADQITELMLNWTTALNITIGLLRDAADEDGRAGVLFNFVRDRMGEAKKAIEASELELRLSMWVYSQPFDVIEFSHSNEIDDETTMNAVFARGQGMLGQAFLEQRTWNEPNARQLPSYLPVVQRPKYLAVYCTPVTFHREPLGMLCMDKNEEATFGERADTIARTLAAIIAAAVAEYERLHAPRTRSDRDPA